MFKLLKLTFFTGCICVLLGLIAYLYINFVIVRVGNKYTITLETPVEDADAIIVLGARVFSEERLSAILYDRMTVGIEAYEKGLAPKLLLSGDHGQDEYDEVNAMRKFAQKKGIPTEDIFMDHAGFSTYETIYRARDIFKTKKVIIVTQDYHLKRAIYTARKMGLEAYGIAADRQPYYKINYFKFRETLARVKDYLYVNILKPTPTYLGEEIPISGNGVITHDKDD